MIFPEEGFFGGEAWKQLEKHTKKSHFCLVGGALGIAQAKQITKREERIEPLKLIYSNF